MNSTKTLSNTSIVTASESNLSSELNGETIILDIESGTYFGLDSVGAKIWNLIAEPKKVMDIRDVIANQYQIDLKHCENDILNLLEELANEGLIEVRDEVIA